MAGWLLAALLAVSLAVFGTLGRKERASDDLAVALQRSGSLSHEDFDDNVLNRFGRVADPSERNALIALAKRYVAAAAAGDGVAACRLMDPATARSVAYSEVIYTGGKTAKGSCARIAKGALREVRGSQLMSYVITDVRANTSEAYVQLSSPTRPARYLTAHRGPAGWAINSVTISPVP